MADEAHYVNRGMRLKSPFGEDVLTFLDAVVEEELGRLFKITLRCFAEAHNLNPADALGSNMTLELDTDSGTPRYFDGLVSRFDYMGNCGDWAAYRMELRPWFWCLTRTTDCRIFQNLTADTIVTDLLRESADELGITAELRNALTGSYREREYCVQYRETDFRFLSRLMEEEGIYYFFEHEDGKHTMVLADSGSAHEVANGCSEICYYPRVSLSHREQDHIYDWRWGHGLRSGAFALDDFDFKKPTTDLLVQMNSTHSDIDKGEIYDYPGLYLETSDGDHYVRMRAEESDAQSLVVQGEGNVRFLATGGLFSLTNFEHDQSQNGEYLMTRATHRLENREIKENIGFSKNFDDHDWEEDRALKDDLGDKRVEAYRCLFHGISSDVPFRPRRITPKALVRGPQTAIVCGKNGEEIWTDEWGRIKVQFHWDDEGQNDENTTCFIRVAQFWGGLDRGAWFLPRIGDEVMVDFLEGNPDRPVIVGSLYNDDQKPPYTLPENQTVSTIKTKSSKNSEGFNELKFEDKVDEEEIYFQAERDFKRVVKNDDVLEVGLEKQDPGDQTITIHNNRTTTINEGDDTLTIEQGNLTIDISQGTATITAAQKIELKVGESTKITMDTSSITLEATTIDVKATSTVTTTGAMNNVDASGNVMVTGALVKIN
jgi:type VI secretion system secreted protein VgrG